MNNKQKVIFGALILLSFFFFFFRLGTLPLYDYDEAHYAQVVQHTLASDNLLTFKRSGTEWFEKPPLLLWLTIGSIALWGESELAMRLPTALLGVAAIWGVYLLTFFLTKNYWAALGSGFILLFSGMFTASGRQLRMDVPLSAAIIFAVYSFVKGWEKPKWYLGFWFWIAVGLLIKSVPVFFTGPVAIIFSTIYQRWSWLKNAYFWLGVLLFLAIVAPWHIYESLKFGSRFWSEYLGYHIWQRATQKILGGNVTSWDYLKELFFLTEPWFILVFFLLVFLWLYRRREFSGFRLALASFFSGIFIFFVFAAARTKLLFYLIPILPFEAMAVSAASLFLFKAVGWRHKKNIFALIGTFAFLIAIVSISLQVFYFQAPYAYPHAIDEREIGKLIKQRYGGHAIYSFDWKAYETIYYYSGGHKPNIQLVGKEDLKIGFKPPYFIIMPKTYLSNKKQTGLNLLYEGKYLVLLEAEQKRVE